MVREIRREEPMTGCRKLYDRLQPRFEQEGIGLGRDKLFELLSERGMLVKVRRKAQRTTYSNHSYAVAPNRLKNREVSAPNQVFVSDITYLTLRSGFAYLFLVTDLYSRKIVGHYLSKDLRHQGAIEALRRALHEVPDSQGILHHSDRGCQYCCHEFLRYLGENGMSSSMTDENHCYQNAVAERVNGILKLEFYLDSNFSNHAQAAKAVADAIRVYNFKRTHWSLGLKTPAEVYHTTGDLGAATNNDNLPVAVGG
jgi:transposase InsO family protein